eukprot:1147835-Pelagomonas_calceolata.AAC.2
MGNKRLARFVAQGQYRMSPEEWREHLLENGRRHVGEKEYDGTVLFPCNIYRPPPYVTHTLNNLERSEVWPLLNGKHAHSGLQHEHN